MARPMSHRLVEPGVIEVLYESAAEMAPPAQEPLQRLIERSLEAGPVALVFRVHRVPVVDAAVPKFWMEMTRQLAPGLCALAITSPSMAVRAAARAFSVMNTLRRVEVDVQAFIDEDEALAWARTRRSARCAV